jgi:hypothetical protein
MLQYSLIYFRCLDGKVVSARTNSRLADLRCGEDRFFGLASVPDCVQPTHCVGPVDAAANVVARPQRDVAVHASVSAKCKGEEEDRVIRGSCFPDGVVRNVIRQRLSEYRIFPFYRRFSS